MMIALKEKVISKLGLCGFLNVAQRQAGAGLKCSMGDSERGEGECCAGDRSLLGAGAQRAEVAREKMGT